MIRYALRIKDRFISDELDELIDAINALDIQLTQVESCCDKLRIPTMREIQQALQQGGSNPLNLTGLQGRGGT